MKKVFKKIAVIGASLLMAGFSAGIAAAASFPAPFVQNGAADVAIVYGANANVLDNTAGVNIQNTLGESMPNTGFTIEGESAGLDTSADRVWLNTSLNSVKSTFTSADLPTILGDSTFSGNVDADITSTIKFTAGAANGQEHSGKVWFGKQPKSTNDPQMGVSLSTSISNALYNESATFSKAVNFTNSDSEGETVHLFGQDFVVSTATSTTDLVLFKSASEATLTVGGANPSPTATITVDNVAYTVTLTNGDSTTAYLTVNGDSASISEGNSKKVGGVDIAVKDIVAGSDTIGTTATILVGAQKLTFTDGQIVTEGSDNNPIDGTKAYIVGGTGATTELAVTVFAPDSNSDAILAGESFTDPIFEGFSVNFAGLSSPLDDSTRGMVSVENSGDDTMTVTATDSDGNEATAGFAHNESSQYFLGDDANYTIHVQEMANLSENEYIMIGNEDYGHFLQVYQISNSSSSSPGDDRVRFTDVFSGDNYETTFSTTEGSGTLTIDGKQYTVTFRGSGDSGWAQLKYPTSESTANQLIVFPTVQLEGNALMSLYEPVTLDLTSFDLSATNVTGIKLPNGDGYTTVTLAYANDTNGSWWDVSGAGTGALNTSSSSSSVSLTVGQLTYHINGTSANNSKIYLVNPESSAEITAPSVVLFEGKDDSNNYEAIVVASEATAVGSSTNGLGVGDIYFSSPTHYSATMKSDSDITEDVDWYGTLTKIDASDSDQKTASVTYPSEQVYADLSVSEGTVSSSGSALGDVLVTDAEVASVSDKNLIVVGGSCINSAAATLLGGAYCGPNFTSATDVGAGQFLIQSFGDAYTTGKIALLVAGYNVDDTVNAATYLRTQDVDTMAGNKYIGTSSTEATLQVA